MAAYVVIEQRVQNLRSALAARDARIRELERDIVRWRRAAVDEGRALAAHQCDPDRRASSQLSDARLVLGALVLRRRLLDALGVTEQLHRGLFPLHEEMYGALRDEASERAVVTRLVARLPLDVEAVERWFRGLVADFPDSCTGADLVAATLRLQLYAQVLAHSTAITDLYADIERTR